MNKVVIITDSTVDLSKDLVEKLNIKVMPLYIIFDNETFQDGVNIDNPKLFAKVEEYKKLPKTSGAAPGEFVKFFTPYIEEGYDIFYMGIGSELSCTYRSAMIAAGEFPKGRVVVCDSMNLSGGIGLLIIKAAKYRDMGLSALEIKEKIDQITPHVKCQFVVESLDYLHKGGRCSGVAKFFGTMLRLKPLIVVRNGKLSVGKKIIGSVKKALNVMIELFMSDLKNVDPDCILVTGVCATENEDHIRHSIDNEEVHKYVKNIYYTEAGSVIASHCGKGTIGILYIVNNHFDETDNEILSKEE